MMTSSVVSECFIVTGLHASRELEGDRVQSRAVHGGSLDDLVGAGEQYRRNIDSDHLPGLGIDDQLELRRLLNRKVGRLCTLQYLVQIVDGVAIHIVHV